MTGRIVQTDRRTLITAMLALPLTGCDAAPYGVDMDQWVSALKMATGMGNAPGLQREQVEQIPFATISYQIGDSGISILILAEKSGTSSLWTSSQRLAIVTSRGRILQTSGFRWNLTATNFIESDPVGTALLLGSPKEAFHRQCDFSDVHKFQMAIVAEFEIQKEETITVLGSDINTVRVIEHCRCDALEWEFNNIYWIDAASGFVWQSAQYIHPNEARFTVTVLRPEA
jgi:hypothetical protein